jgi:iron-sulfur cluster assembly accessory protein
MHGETMADAQPVRLTERAAKRIGEILRSEPGAAMLRVAVTGGGCSGFQYDFCIDEARADDDVLIARDDAKVLIDPISLDFLKGAEIDFVEEMIGAAFRLPAAAARVFRLGELL